MVFVRKMMNNETKWARDLGSMISVLILLVEESKEK